MTDRWTIFHVELDRAARCPLLRSGPLYCPHLRSGPQEEYEEMVADSAQKRASDSKSLTDKETAKADGEVNDSS